MTGLTFRNLRWFGKNSMSLCCALLTAVMTVTAPAQSADQADVQACTTYALEAIQHKQRNISGNCGFQGERWTASGERHLAWCLSSREDRGSFDDPADWNETAIRRAELAQCEATNVKNAKEEVDNKRNDEIVSARCSAYTELALTAAKFNVEKKCGFNDGRWTLDANAHFDWCVGTTESAANVENQVRAEAMQNCNAKKSTATGTQSSAKLVCLYFDRDFSGTERCMPKIGKYPINVNRANQYSSTKIAPGYVLTIYDGPNQTGRACSYSSNTPRFKSKCDNMAESIEIEEE
jgi:hypothetical protein